MLSRRDVLRLLLLSLCLGSAWPQLFEDTPAFAASAIVAHERGSFEALCVDSCGWGPALSAQRAHYRDLDRVFIIDWGGMGMNGLGNSLIHFLRPLAAGALADRASFSRRNAAGCADSAGGCRMDPGAFVGTRRGAAWAWTDALAAALRARGAEEATLRFDNASLGFVLRRGSGQETRLPGVSDVHSLLLHEAVAPLPWVRFAWPSAPGDLSAVNALWKASPVAGEPWGKGVVSGNLVERAMEASPVMQQRAQQCSGGEARRCLFASFLHPLPHFQLTLAPYLRRMDAAWDSGGVVVGVQVRSGYADYVSSAGGVQPDEAHPQPRAFTAAERQQVHADEWDKLNGVYPQTCAASPPPQPASPLPPAAGPTPNVSSCVRLSPVVQAAVSSRGASCSSSNTSTAFTLGAEEGHGGVLSSLLSCAANVAQSASSGPAAGWLLYVAGDLPPLFLLANASVALKSHVLTAEGRLGHVSFNQLCHVEPGTAEKSCTRAALDPEGAWTRTMLDLFLLGTFNISTLHQGTSSFPGAIDLRRTWPRLEAATGWDVHVIGPDERQVRLRLHTVADQVMHQLEAEAQADDTDAQTDCVRFLDCAAMDGADVILAALHCAYVARRLDAVWTSSAALTLLGKASAEVAANNTLPVVPLGSLLEAARFDDAFRKGGSGAPARVCGVTFAARVARCGDGTWCTGLDELPQLQPQELPARSRCLSDAGAGQADGAVGIAWHVGHGYLGNADHVAGLFALLNASFAVARNHTLTLLGGADVANLTTRAEFTAARVVPADASMSEQLCALLAADVVLANAGVATLLAAFIDERSGNKPFVIELQRHHQTPGAAEVTDVGPRSSSRSVLAPDAVLHKGAPVGQNDFQFLTALDARLYSGIASAAASLPSRVTLTPFNATWQLDAETYMHVGWYRSNASELGAARDALLKLDPARANLGVWDDRPGCALRSSIRIEVRDIDQVQLSRCNGTAPGGAVVPMKTLVTMCSTLLHGRHANFNAYWLRVWMQHHAALGVGHFFLYVSNLTLPWFGYDLSYDVLDVSSWEPAFYSHNYEGLGGALNLQPWVQHDCLYRNKALGNAWALFMDPDELLALPGMDGLVGLTRQMDEQGLDGASFGSVPYLPSPHLLTNKTRLRAPLPEGCLKWEFAGYWTCPDWHGRRKFIARVNVTMQLDIHDIANVDRSRFAVVNASRVWLRHYRGVPYEDLTLITAEFNRCTSASDGLSCEGMFYLASGNFTSEQPFLDLALAQTALPLRPPPSPPSPPQPPPAPTPPSPPARRRLQASKMQRTNAASIV